MSIQPIFRLVLTISLIMFRPSTQLSCLTGYHNINTCILNQRAESLDSKHGNEMVSFRAGLLSKRKPLQSTNNLPHARRTSERHRIPEAHPVFYLIITTNLMFALRQTSSLFTRRNFSTTSRIMSQKYEWMVILPDNVGALDKRMAVRE